MRSSAIVVWCVVTLLGTSVVQGAERAVPVPVITARGAIVINGTTGATLWSRDPHEPRAMASTTKIMTALIAIERGNLDDIVNVGYYPTQVGATCLTSGTPTEADPCPDPLRWRERVRLEDLLYGMIFTSGNNAAQAVAEYVVGRRSTNSEEGLTINGEFAAIMNNRAAAEDLQLANTHFRNPHGRDPVDLVGLDCDSGENCGHYSTPYDLAQLARIALGNPTFATIVKSRTWPTFESHWYNLVTGTDESKVYTLTNDNLSGELRSYAGRNGVKAGFTGNAGLCMVSSATLLGKSVIAVVLHSDQGERFADSVKLLDYGFDRRIAVDRLGDSAGQAGWVGDIEVVSYTADRVATAVSDAAGNLKLITWKAEPGGGMTRLHDSGALAGAVSELALAALDSGTLVTAVRDSRGNLKLITWRVDANGRVTRPQSNATPGPQGQQISVIATSDSRIVTAMRDAQGVLKVMSWTLNANYGWSELDESTSTDLVDRVAMTSYCLDCGFSGDLPPSFRMITAVRDRDDRINPDRLKLIAWDMDANGQLTRQGFGFDNAAWGTEVDVEYDRAFGRLVTAGRNAAGNLQLTSWSISEDGRSIDRLRDTLDNAGPAIGAARQIKISSMPGGGGFTTALRDSALDLKLVVWGIDQAGRLRRLDDSDSQAGQVSQVALSSNAGGGFVTAVKASEGNLKLINWRVR